MPDMPVAPKTLLNGDYITFNWETPYSGGSPITGYRIYFRKSDGLTFN